MEAFVREENAVDIEQSVEMTQPVEFWSTRYPIRRYDGQYSPITKYLQRSDPNNQWINWKSVWVHFHLLSPVTKTRALANIFQHTSKDHEDFMNNMLAVSITLKREVEMRKQLEQVLSKQQTRARNWAFLFQPLTIPSNENEGEESEQPSSKKEEEDEGLPIAKKPKTISTEESKKEITEDFRSKEEELEFLVRNIRYPVIEIGSSLEWSTDNYKWDLVYAAKIECYVLGRKGSAIGFTFIGESTHCYDDAGK
jgi:hypothetical protein